LEEDIRKFARGAKEFGKPFLMRLNNEMNSTWVSYSGHLCLNDPDVFKAVWRKVYNIFQEEGVDNAIWIFNPNDVSFPPCRWNSHVAYYPGNGYVHMIGLTGYNTGDYFRDVTGERWRSFTEIYDRLWEMYKDLYAGFPWIITEFASSSVGGDKKAWIEEMFDNISRYTNIKIAVWWSYYDPDPREATYGTPARRYWLDEKPEYLEAFKKGLERTVKSP
jgi:mannan endo-1,4-beta-mannosidase